MIDKMYGDFVLICDVCDREVKPFNSFSEAVEYKKDNDWHSIRQTDGEWTEVCPECWEDI